MIRVPPPLFHLPCIAVATFDCCAAFSTTSPAVSIAGTLSSPPGPCTTHPCANLPIDTGPISPIHMGDTLFAALISELIHCIALLMNDSIIPIVELNILLAAHVTVDSIFVNVSVNFDDPSPENQAVSDVHTFITPSFREFHLLMAVVDIKSHRLDR